MTDSKVRRARSTNSTQAKAQLNPAQGVPCGAHSQIGFKGEIGFYPIAHDEPMHSQPVQLVSSRSWWDGHEIYLLGNQVHINILSGNEDGELRNDIGPQGL